jgi:multicomponent Na+:H+ antiporter subunit D
MTQQAPVLIIAIPMIASFFNLLIGWRFKGFCYPWVVAALSVCTLASFATLGTVITDGTIHYRLGSWAPPWGIEYVIDHLNAFMLVIVSFISLLVAIYSKKSIEQELPTKIVPFYSIFLLLITGLLGILITGDMFNLYVFLEVASLAGYALIAIGDEKAPLASFEYVVIGTVGACFYLLGVGYLYIVTGSLNMADLSQLLPQLYLSKIIVIAFAFFVVGVAIKMAFFPLHVWLPDAYTHAPSTVSALVASTMTKVGAYVMIRIMFTVFRPYFSIELVPVTTILGWVAVVAMMFGLINAIAQYDFKRMLCYVIIAEVGYIVLGLSVANRMGVTGAILHILYDAFMMACLFLVAGAIIYKTGTRDITQFRHLNKKMPFTMAAFTIAALSVIGLPPTCGFFSKWYLVMGAIDAQQWAFAAALMISSLLSAVIFFKVIENVYFEPPLTGHEQVEEGAHEEVTQHGEAAAHKEIAMDEAPMSMLIPIYITVAGILVLGILSGKIISTVVRFAVPASF